MGGGVSVKLDIHIHDKDGFTEKGHDVLLTLSLLDGFALEVD